MKKLKDIILKKLTDASMSGCSSLNVFKKGTVIDNPANNAIACIPVVPQVTGSYIAGMYKEEYAKLVPYENCDVVDEKIFHSIESGVHHYISIIIIDPPVSKEQCSESDSFLRNTDTPEYTSDTPLRDQLMDILTDFRNTENAFRVFVRSVNTLKVLGDFSIDEIDSKYVDKFLEVYGEHKIVAKAVRAMAGLSPMPEKEVPSHKYLDVFVDDFNYSYARQFNTTSLVKNRLKLMEFMIREYDKENSFSSCAQMSITMQDAQNYIVDYVNLKF